MSQAGPVFLGREWAGFPPHKVEPVSQILRDVRSGHEKDPSAVVSRLFWAILGRAPGVSERATYVGVLESNRWGQANVLATMMAVEALTKGALQELGNLGGGAGGQGACLSFIQNPHNPVIQYFTSPIEISEVTFHYRATSMGVTLEPAPPPWNIPLPVGKAWITGSLGYGEQNNTPAGYVDHLVYDVCKQVQQADQQIVDVGSNILNALHQHHLELPGSPLASAFDVAADRRGIAPSGSTSALPTTFDPDPSGPASVSNPFPKFQAPVFSAPFRVDDGWDVLWKTIQYIATSVGLDNMPSLFNPFSWNPMNWFGPAEGKMTVSVFGTTSMAVTFLGNVLSQNRSFSPTNMTLPVKRIGLDIAW